MDWTAEQVHELVKDWPDEVKPQHMRAIPVGTYDAARTYYADRDGNAIELETVIDCHVGRGLSWLLSRKPDRTIGVLPIRDHRGTFQLGLAAKDGVYASLLEAVSAAVLAAKGGANA